MKASQLRSELHCTAWCGVVPVDLSGVIEGARLASLVDDGLALEELKEVWWLLALGDADLTAERGEREGEERMSRWCEREMMGARSE